MCARHRRWWSQRASQDYQPLEPIQPLNVQWAKGKGSTKRKRERNGDGDVSDHGRTSGEGAAHCNSAGIGRGGGGASQMLHARNSDLRFFKLGRTAS